MYAPMPAHVREFTILQVAVSNGAKSPYTIRPEDFRYVRADGSVIGERDGFWIGSAMSAVLQPGDTVVVPEKALTPGPQWTNLLLGAQAAASIASAVFVAVHY